LAIFLARKLEFVARHAPSAEELRAARAKPEECRRGQLGRVGRRDRKRELRLCVELGCDEARMHGVGLDIGILCAGVSIVMAAKQRRASKLTESDVLDEAIHGVFTNLEYSVRWVYKWAGQNKGRTE
jgi:hypothetical protein